MSREHRMVWLIPELDLFETKDQREAARRLAWRVVHTSWRYWLVYATAFVVVLKVKWGGFALPGGLQSYVLPAVLIGGMPMIGLLLLRRKIRIALLLAAAKLQPRCPQCGYDLRGSPSGRCPECGWVAPPPSRIRPAQPIQLPPR